MAMNQETRTPEEIESDIEQTRSEMAHTLNELQRKLSPTQLLDEALGYLQGQQGSLGRNLGTIIKENPLPATLVGFGLAWLMLSGTSESSSAATPAGLRSAAGEALGAAKDKISGKAGDIGHGVSEAIGGAREKSQEIAGQIRSQAEHLGEKMQGQFRSMLREQPLLLGAIGIAIGAVLGASLPRTRRESEAVGEPIEHRPAEMSTGISQPRASAMETGTHAGPAGERRHGPTERRQRLQGMPPSISERRRGPVERRGLSAASFLSM